MGPEGVLGCSSVSSVVEALRHAQLKRAVGLRNVVAHGYAPVNVTMVHDAATHGVRELETFAHDVAVYLRAQPD